MTGQKVVASMPPMSHVSLVSSGDIVVLPRTGQDLRTGVKTGATTEERRHVLDAEAAGTAPAGDGLGLNETASSGYYARCTAVAVREIRGVAVRTGS